MGNLQ